MPRRATNGKHPRAAGAAQAEPLRSLHPPSRWCQALPPAAALSSRPPPGHPRCPQRLVCQISHTPTPASLPPASPPLPAPSLPRTSPHPTSFFRNSVCPEPRRVLATGEKKPQEDRSDTGFFRRRAGVAGLPGAVASPAQSSALGSLRLPGGTRLTRSLGRSPGSSHAGGGQAAGTEPPAGPGAVPTPGRERGWPGTGGSVAWRGGE